MSQAEHAIENAVWAIERAIEKVKREGASKAAYDAFDDAYRKWKNTDQNLTQLSATPIEIRDMAMWVVYNDRPAQRTKEERE